MKTAVLVLALLALAGCKPKEPPKPAPPPVLPPVSKDPKHDHTRSYLTDERMARLLQSMAEEKNPFEEIFRDGGPTTFSTITERLAENDGFARRYGFQDSEEYCAVWGRVAVCESVLGVKELEEETRGKVNPRDLEIVRKYRSQIEDARRRFKKP